jgi:hypothetical protein
LVFASDAAFVSRGTTTQKLPIPTILITATNPVMMTGLSTSSTTSAGLRARGGTVSTGGGGLGVAPLSSLSTPTSKSDVVVPVTKKIRIEALDSMRFFLIIQIVLGHFISFANPSKVVLTFFSQHNVLVGAFFALSGYVTVRCLYYPSFECLQ